MQVEAHERETIWILDDGRVLGGGQLFNVRLGVHLGSGVTIACPPGSPLADLARAEGLQVAAIPFPAPNVWHLPALVAASLRLRHLVPPNAVVVPGAIRTTLVAQLAHLPNPMVVLMHERVSAARLSVKLALRKCPALIVVGTESANEYRQALPAAGVWAVNNFLSATTLRKLCAIRGQKPPGPRGRLVLGVLARLIPEKGVGVLIEELARHPEAWGELIVGGSGADEPYALTLDRAVEIAGLRERVSLVGAIDDVPQFLSQLDVLIVPSIGPEGQPTVILEGLAAGLPVIVRAQMATTDFAGLPVVDYHDPDQLWQRILHLPDPVEPRLLAERFGADQVVAALREAIDAARPQATQPA